MTTRPARPALDAWLAKAERVLSEARDDALSPSTASGPWDEHRTERATTLAELDAHLEELLYRLVFGPGRWVLIIEDPLGRYVQVLAFEDGSLVAEVVSNHYLEDEQRWGQADGDKLVALGWSAPGEKRPNWQVSYATISPDIAEVAVLLTATLRTVFGLGEAGPLTVTMFSSPRREGTAASQAVRANVDEAGADRQPVARPATAPGPEEARAAKLPASSAATLESIRATEDWSDEAWVAEVRRVVDPSRLSRTSDGPLAPRTALAANGATGLSPRPRDPDAG